MLLKIMIPKVIYQVSIGLHHESILDTTQKMMEINPSYKRELTTDEAEIDSFVNENFPGEVSECYNRLNILVAKIDFWRYLKLYKDGGIYLDIDSAIIKSLDNLVKDTDEAIITAERNPNKYVQWALFFSKGHPILERTIEFIVDNIRNNSYPNNIFEMTGPVVYSKAIRSIHLENFNEILEWSSITSQTDTTYQNQNVCYRLYGFDYNEYLVFKHDQHNLLYTNTVHWTQKNESLLKSDTPKL